MKIEILHHYTYTQFIKELLPDILSGKKARITHIKVNHLYKNTEYLIQKDEINLFGFKIKSYVYTFKAKDFEDLFYKRFKTNCSDYRNFEDQYRTVLVKEMIVDFKKEDKQFFKKKKRRNKL